MKKIYIIFIISLTIASCKKDKKSTPVNYSLTEEKTVEKQFTPTTEAEKIAYANGFEHWEKVKKIDFTFNVERNGERVAQRSWSWKPQTDYIKMSSAKDTVTYKRSADLDSISKQADKGFINDKFWLLTSYQLLWDEGTTITTQKDVISPLLEKPAHKLTIVYDDKGGYTPGDAYDFYYDDNYMITEWVFRNNNSPEPTMNTTFEGYQTYQGINIATEHKDKGDSLNIYFTNIKVIR